MATFARIMVRPHPFKKVRDRIRKARAAQERGLARIERNLGRAATWQIGFAAAHELYRRGDIQGFATVSFRDFKHRKVEEYIISQLGESPHMPAVQLLQILAGFESSVHDAQSFHLLQIRRVPDPPFRTEGQSVLVLLYLRNEKEHKALHRLLGFRQERPLT